MIKIQCHKNNCNKNKNTKIIFQIIQEIVKSIRMKSTFNREIFII